MTLKRIHIFGVCGSGKTFLSKELSRKLKIKSYDLDDIFWTKKGKREHDIKRDDKERNGLLKELVKKDKWIIEGCYSSWIEDSIKRSDLVIWLDPPFLILAKRMIIRFLKRKLFFSKKEWKGLWGLLKYAKNYHKVGQKVGYYEHNKLIRKHKANFVYLKTKRDVNKFLKEFQK